LSRPRGRRWRSASYRRPAAVRRFRGGFGPLLPAGEQAGPRRRFHPHREWRLGAWSARSRHRRTGPESAVHRRVLLGSDSAASNDHDRPSVTRPTRRRRARVAPLVSTARNGAWLGAGEASPHSSRRARSQVFGRASGATSIERALRSPRFDAVYARSIDDPEGFWGEAARALDWDEPPLRVLDRDAIPLARWFPDGHLLVGSGRVFSLPLPSGPSRLARGPRSP
jgi:hypothetical protein